MTRIERIASRATHGLFYVLTLGMPLVGWAMVSASPLGLPTMVFGLIELPHIGWLSGLGGGVEAAFKSAHRAMGYALIGLLALHIAAALKHHLIDRDDVLARMLPQGRRGALPAHWLQERGPMMALLRAVMVVGLCWLGARAGVAAEWIVDAGESRIAFSGTHTGRAFSGSFQSWVADITFDPDHLASSKAVVRVDLASATTGNATYDKTLPTPDWLDTTRSAVAVFETISFRIVAPGGGARWYVRSRWDIGDARCEAARDVGV